MPCPRLGDAEGWPGAARGDDTDPASEQEMGAKFLRLAGRVLGESTARKLAEVIDTLDERPAADLLALLRRDAAP